MPRTIRSMMPVILACSIAGCVTTGGTLTTSAQRLEHSTYNLYDEAFHDLSRSYHALRDDVERSRSAAVDWEFRPVTQAYLDMEREMRGHGYYRDYRDYRDRDFRG